MGVQFLDGVNFDFTYGNASTLSAGAYGVVVRNLDAFKARYSNWASLNILGSYTGRLSNSSEELELGYAPTNMLPLVSFDYEDDWYPCTDGEGFSLVLDDPSSDPLTWDTRQAWRPSSAPDGTPGEANPAPAHPQGTVVINEVLTHQDTGALCYTCHASVPQFHLGFAPVGSPRFGQQSVCTNCHVTIHGSNLDRNFLR